MIGIRISILGTHKPHTTVMHEADRLCQQITQQAVCMLFIRKQVKPGSELTNIPAKWPMIGREFPMSIYAHPPIYHVPNTDTENNRSLVYITKLTTL